MFSMEYARIIVVILVFYFITFDLSITLFMAFLMLPFKEPKFINFYTPFIALEFTNQRSLVC